jgi:hypothetical protein
MQESQKFNLKKPRYLKQGAKMAIYNHSFFTRDIQSHNYRMHHPHKITNKK